MLFMSYVCYAFASVHCCLVVSCWESVDNLALICDVYCVCVCVFFFLFSHVVSWVSGGT